MPAVGTFVYCLLTIYTTKVYQESTLGDFRHACAFMTKAKSDESPGGAAMSAYRFRRCRSCGSVFPGGQLEVLRLGSGHWHQRGGSLRRCPRCGRTGFTQDFPVVV